MKAIELAFYFLILYLEKSIVLSKIVIYVWSRTKVAKEAKAA